MYTKSRRWPVFVIAFVTVLLWAGAVGAWLNQQAIHDWWRLRSYEPNQEIVALADTVKMTDYARQVFYVQHPAVEPASSFNQYCRHGNEFTIVLGCYISGQGIYIFRVDDKRLQGIEEVTAAHEMLHAVYERLSEQDRILIDKTTRLYFESRATDKLRQTIGQYENNDPSSVPSELYAILGTEVRNIPSDLERHYATYFTDRTRVVALAEQYEQAFSERKEKIDALAKELTRLKDTIDTQRSLLDAESRALSTEYDRINRISNTADPQSFRQVAEEYNERVRQYNEAVAQITELIETYNETYEIYQSVVLEQQDLFNAIDSRPKTINTQ